MNFETNEERIERLESIIGSLVRVLDGTAGDSKNHCRVELLLAGELLFLRQENLALIKVFLSCFQAIDPAIKQTFLGQIARYESEHEKLEAVMAQLKVSLEIAPSDPFDGQLSGQ